MLETWVIPLAETTHLNSQRECKDLSHEREEGNKGGGRGSPARIQHQHFNPRGSSPWISDKKLSGSCLVSVEYLVRCTNE